MAGYRPMLTLWKATGLPKGPGTDPVAVSDTAGLAVYPVHHQLDCGVAPAGAMTTTMSPFTTVIPTEVPSLVIAASHVDAQWMQPTLDLFTVFGSPGQDGTQAGCKEALTTRARPLVKEFGDNAPNLDALDKIDLAGFHPVFTEFKSNYYDVFQYHRPYTPAAQRFIDRNGDWDVAMINEVYNQFEQSPVTSPIHVLERWWAHATCVIGARAL